jgi:hypothetical protein
MFRYLEHRKVLYPNSTHKGEKSMKRLVWVVPVVALAAVVLFTASRRFAARSESHNGGDVASADVTITGGTNRGVVFYTAAINSNATVASCFGCNKSLTLQPEGTGTYQVAFNQNVTANSGFSRWVQVDTLTTGSTINVSCTTADRSGVTTAVWVECFNNMTGAPENTSFFLFVAR